MSEFLDKIMAQKAILTQEEKHEFKEIAEFLLSDKGREGTNIKVTGVKTIALATVILTGLEALKNGQKI